MEVKLSYKQTDIGAIPSSWSLTSLENICAAPITYGIVQCGPHIENGIPYIRVSDMNRRELDVSGMLRTSPAIAARFSRSRVQEGDVVYALRGNIGEVRTVGSPVAGANLTQGTARLSPNNLVRTPYLLWSLRSLTSLRQAELEAKGSTFREITLASLRRIQLPIPPLSEQDSIAEALSDADALVESLEQLVIKKRNLKQGAMQELLAGKTRLPGFKEKWGTHSVSEYFEFVSTRNAELNDNVVTISAQQGFVRQEEFFKKRVASKVLENYYLIQRGNFAYNRSYSNGYPFGAIKRLTKYAKGVVTTLYICFALKPDADADPSFFEHYFEAGLLNSGLATVTNEGGRAHGLLNITKADFFSRELNCPSGTEQTAIAAILCDMDAEIAALEAKLGKARHLKQGMMQELLTGKVRLA
jgi:type I restriction enzyme S subunit